MRDHEILKELLPFIDAAKVGESSLSFVDIILEFSEVREIPLQRVQEAINTDVYFKKLMLHDCVQHGIIKTDKEGLEEW